MPRAVGLADELLSRWAPVIAQLEMVSSSGGRFEVSLDGELLFSKASLRRHANPGEIVELFRSRLGPEPLG
ncbi:MAG TPA: Rdx family protein [Actinomycetota bacterium]|nr:Rdx family protein [Actinomycetota bacterium]